MANTATVHARLDCNLKENVEAILASLGLTSTDAIKLFYKQVELNRGLPFEIKLPTKAPTAFEALTDEQFNAVIEQGIAEYAAGKVHSAVDVRAQMKSEFGV